MALMRLKLYKLKPLKVVLYRQCWVLPAMFRKYYVEIRRSLHWGRCQKVTLAIQ